MYFLKLAETLSKTKRSERPELLKEVFKKNLNKDLPKGYKVDDLKVSSPLFGLLSPQLRFKILDKKGNNIIQEDDYWSIDGEGGGTLRKKLLRNKYNFDADALYLKPEYRKKGIGGKVFKSMIETSEELGVDKINMMAEEEGKVVWPRFKGVEFRKNIRRKAYRDYNKWRGKNGGPIITKEDPPSKYPAKFLKQWSPEILDMIPYEYNIKR